MKNVYQDPKYTVIKMELPKKLTAMRLKYKDSETLDKMFIDKYKELEAKSKIIR